MNVFRKYTRSSLAKNRVRTLVTIIGIVLSMALFTAVIEGAYSGLQFLIRAEIASDGAYHGAILDMNEEELSALQAEDEIREIEVWRQVGWATTEYGSDAKPYFVIQDMQKAPSLLSLRIVDGRMPEKETELLLPDSLNAYWNHTVSVGDELTLSVGTRTVDGKPAGQDVPYAWGAESVENTVERTYTVVGVYHRFPYDIEGYEAPGNTLLTVGGGTGSNSAFFTVKHPAKAYSFFQTVDRLGGGVHDHQYLLAFYGGIRGRGMADTLYGFAAILIVLIAFGSISLIYNSFSISVSERTKQFGILKSVGATKKQIRGTVLYEALLLCAVAIPLGLLLGCAGIGLTLYFLRDGFRMLVDSDSGVHMQLVLNLPALLIAAAICLVTTLASAWIPALRAVRISPIRAIRQSEDVKISQRDVRSGKLTQRLFGFTGTMAAKNFRRNRKRYRATIVSLFLSVVLFISASSFCAYLTDMVNNIMSEGAMEYELYYQENELSNEDAEARLQLLLQTEHVTAGTYSTFTGGYMQYRSADVTDGCLNSQTVYVKDGIAEQETRIIFVRDKDFLALCTENGVNADEFFDKAHPMALVKNGVTTRYYNENGSHWENYELFRSDRLPAEVRLEQKKESVDGYILAEEDGESYYYYPEEYLNNYWNTQDGSGEYDRSVARVLTREEAVVSVCFTAGSLLKKVPYYCSEYNSPVLIYPYSLRSAVLQECRGETTTGFAFRTDDHAAAFSEMTEVLKNTGLDENGLYDYAARAQSERMIVTIVNVFSYGFIVLISLIAAANVFNTVSTNISLRRRELAMLQSIGLGRRDFYRMMNYECGIYGAKALLWGLPVAALVTYAIYCVVSRSFSRSFYVPWYSMAIAVGSVFFVVFASMLYAARRIRKVNPIEALKTETV